MVLNTLDDNTVFWSPYYTILENAFAGFATISGCSISKGTGNWDIDVTSGTILVTGTGEVSVSSGTVTLTAPASDADMDAGESRVDLITANSSGTLAVVEGTAASNPDTPNVPSDEVILGFVIVAESDSTASDSDIVDTPALLGDDTARYAGGGSHPLVLVWKEESSSPYTATGASSANSINPSGLDSFDSYLIFLKATDQATSGNNIDLQIDGETGVNYNEIDYGGTRGTGQTEIGPILTVDSGATTTGWFVLFTAAGGKHGFKSLSATSETALISAAEQVNTTWPPSQFTFKRGADTDWEVRVWGRNIS